MNYFVLGIYRKWLGEKPKKPKELKGVSPCATAVFVKLRSQAFVLGNDIYIYHNEYFCQRMPRADGEIGAPLSCLAKKYLDKRVKWHFIYNDCWGDIINHQVAWCKFTDAMPLFRYEPKQMSHVCDKPMSYVDIARLMARLTFEHHDFDPLDSEIFTWERFYENICKQIKQEEII